VTLRARFGNRVTLGNADKTPLLVHRLFHIIRRRIAAMATCTWHTLEMMYILFESGRSLVTKILMAFKTLIRSQRRLRGEEHGRKANQERRNIS
jgi:hypothetical protein